MRAFIALNLPASERAALHAALEPVRAQDLPVRWVDEGALHVTLKFLGGIAGADVERIAAVLRAAAGAGGALHVEIGGLGAFPSLRRAQVVWAGVAADPALNALQRDIELGCSRLGYTREQRVFRPHITVGRAHAGARPPDLERHYGRISHQSRVLIESVELMQSHTGSTGARYETVFSCPLGVRARA